MAMEDTTTKARGKKPTILKKKGGTTHSTSPRRKRLEEEEDEDLPLPSYRNTSVQALYGLFTKAQANISGGVGQQQLAGEGRSDHLRQLAEGVEKGVFEQHGNPVHSHEPTRAYGQQLRTLRYNILQNKDLQARILTGSLSAAAIARLTPEEMLTTTAREEQQEKEAKAHDMLRLDRHLAPQVRMNESREENEGTGVYLFCVPHAFL